ncbi:hypothetical protein Tco_0196634 [Tanacetum coccineum]
MLKKTASPSKKQTLVLEDEPAKKPQHVEKSVPAKEDDSSKKPSRKKSVGVVIRDTPGVSVSKKKAQAKVDRGKGMDLLSDVALLEAAQLKKVLKKSKQDTHMLHANGSDDGVGSQPKVLDELKEKTTGTNERTSTIPWVPYVPKDQFESENESWEDSGDYDDSNDDGGDAEDVHESDDDHDEADDEWTEFDDEEEEKYDDEFIHTPDDYVPTDDETNIESKEFDEEEYEELYGDVNISLKDTEPAGKEKGDVDMTNTKTGDVELENVNQEGAGNQVKDDAQATQKTEVPRTSPLLTIPVSVIPEHTIVNQPEIITTASSTTISSLLITNLEKDVIELKNVDHSAALLSTINSEVPNVVKEYLGTSLDDALHKMEHAKQQQVPKETITSFDTTALTEFDQKTTLFETMTKSKSFNKSPKKRALYHDLMESILEDEDAMDEGVADKLKKMKQDDAD